MLPVPRSPAPPQLPRLAPQAQRMPIPQGTVFCGQQATVFTLQMLVSCLHQRGFQSPEKACVISLKPGQPSVALGMPTLRLKLHCFRSDHRLKLS